MCVLVISSLLIISQPPKAKAAANPNDLISDSVFENTSSMSVSQINSLINSYGGSCIGGSFTTADPHGWDNVNNSGYVYGGNVSGAQAIDSIALNYHLNPQVIITTLQKEQSIVSGGAGCYALPNPATAQPMTNACGNGTLNCTNACPYNGGCMNIAMSYGCPNYCNVNDEGFSSQLTLGSWLLRFAEERSYGILTGYTGFENGDQNFSYGGPMTAGYRQTSASAPLIYYDGSTTISNGSGGTVNVTNGATASLYYYTPFFSGNQSFDNIFQNTFSFGDPSNGSCTGTETPLPYVQIYYNSRTFEHFYSAYGCDANFLYQIGFVNEGPIFNTTLSSNSLATPVYRYYNPATGQHMWDTDLLYGMQPSGYQLDNSGVPAFYVDSPSDPNAKAVYRFYNPRTYLHLWASSQGLTVTNLGTISQAGYYLEGPVFNTQ
jgi:hypothetical protein